MQIGNSKLDPGVTPEIEARPGGPSRLRTLNIARARADCTPTEMHFLEDIHVPAQATSIDAGVRVGTPFESREYILVCGRDYQKVDERKEIKETSNERTFSFFSHKTSCRWRVLFIISPGVWLYSEIPLLPPSSSPSLPPSHRALHATHADRSA